MTEAPPDRPAQKRADLLVVFLLVVASLGLSLGFFQSMRTKRRMDTFKHLKDLGIAMHNYHDHCGAFPSETFVDDTGNTRTREGNLYVQLLPFVHGEAFAASCKGSDGQFDPNSAGAGEPVVFTCPSRHSRAGPWKDFGY